MRQSISSVTSNEEFQTGAVILEGHRIFAFPDYAELATTVVYLAVTDKLLFERGTESSSIRKHKLFLSNVLDQLQELNKMIILEGEKSQVYLVCQALQITLLEDAALDASHLSADIELDGRWTFEFPCAYPQIWRVRVDSGSLFVLTYEPTIHGTISRFHNSLANFWLSLTHTILSGRDNCCVSLRQVQTSKQDNHVVQRKFAFNRQFVRGQSRRLKAFQAFQATIGSSVGRFYFGS